MADCQRPAECQPPANPMSQILVVSPSVENRQEIARILADVPDWSIAKTGDLDQARVLTRLVPLDLLLLDVSSPEVHAAEWIEALSAEQPLLPIVVAADDRSEDEAREALSTSAAGYVPLDRLTTALAPVVRRVLSLTGRPPGRMSVQASQTSQSTAFELGNDPDCVAAIVEHVTTQCCRFGVAGGQEQVRVAIALEEALLNAIIHGNLQVSSDLRERSDNAFRSLVENRRRDPRYAGRRVRLNCDVDPQCARIVIRDEGPGFDVRQLPDPRDSTHLTRASGRGVLLMRSFMDEVVYNSVGNEVTLVKRRHDDQRAPTPGSQSCAP